MTFRYSAALALAFMLLDAGSAYADACSNRARALVAENPGATLLAVKSGKNANGQVVCVARIKLPSSNGNPGRVVTKKFRP